MNITVLLGVVLVVYQLCGTKGRSVTVMLQGSHRLEKYLNMKAFLEKSLKMKYALKSTVDHYKALKST